MSIRLAVRWTKLAGRNVWTNKRRSFFTMLAVAISLGAINVFGGFVRYIDTGLTEGYVYSQGLGHLTILRTRFLQERMQGPFGPLIAEDDIEAVEEVVHGVPEVLLTARELHISGRVASGEHSAPVYALGRVASKVEEINGLARGMVSRVRLYDGEPLRDELPNLISISRSLASLLEVEQGANLTFSGPTRSGGGRTLSAQLGSVFDPPLEGVSYRLMLVSLDFAQNLTDTRGIDRLTVLLERRADVQQVKRRLENALEGLALDLEVKSLVDLDPFLTRTKGMFDTIFWIISVIVFAVATTTVVNTIAMTILERRREVGTLRALGTRRWAIVEMFAIEGAVLGFLGSLLGILMTLASWYLFKVYEPTWVPPYVGIRVPLEIELIPTYLVGSTLVMTMLAALSAVAPAHRAARETIPEALGQD